MSFHIPIWDRTEREMISVPRFKSNSASEICGNLFICNPLTVKLTIVIDIIM